MWFFTRAEQVVERVEAKLEEDVHAVFARVRQEALDANSEVTRLKNALQDALVRARDLHKAAADAAAAAAAQAEQTAQQLRTAIGAHTRDMNIQASQITESGEDKSNPSQ
jgi:hypothetical protein